MSCEERMDADGQALMQRIIDAAAGGVIDPDVDKFVITIETDDGGDVKVVAEQVTLNELKGLLEQEDIEAICILSLPEPLLPDPLT